MSAHVDAAGSRVPSRQGAEFVHQRVRSAILRGDIPPGATMSQVALAEELGVSPTPLREALRMLQGEGLIEARVNRQVRVAPISAEDLDELYAVRVSLETQALRLSVRRMRSEHIARLEGSIAEMTHHAERRDPLRWLVPHTEYHCQLIELAGSRFSLLLTRLHEHAERYRRIHPGIGPTARTTAEHRAILDAAKAGNEQLAAALLAAHLSRVAFEVAEILEPGRPLCSLTRVLGDAGAAPPVQLRRSTTSVP